MARQNGLVIGRAPDLAIESQSTFLTALGHIYCQQGEKRLMLAVLKDAATCVERYYRIDNHSSRPAYRAALDWILSQDQRWPFSFENICLTLDFDPVQVRAALLSANYAPNGTRQVCRASGEIRTGRSQMRTARPMNRVASPSGEPCIARHS